MEQGYLSQYWILRTFMSHSQVHPSDEDKIAGNELKGAPMPKAIFIDFYGTVVHEDGSVIADITE